MFFKLMMWDEVQMIRLELRNPGCYQMGGWLTMHEDDFS